MRPLRAISMVFTPTIHFSGVLNDSYMLGLGYEGGALFYFNEKSSARFSFGQSWGVMGQSNQMTEVGGDVSYKLGENWNLNGFCRWTESFHQDWTEFGVGLSYFF